MPDLGDRKDEPIDELEFAKSRASSLARILRQYGRHRSDCRMFEPCETNESKPCSCGWSDITTELQLI